MLCSVDSNQIKLNIKFHRLSTRVSGASFRSEVPSLQMSARPMSFVVCPSFLSAFICSAFPKPHASVYRTRRFKHQQPRNASIRQERPLLGSSLSRARCPLYILRSARQLS